MSRPSPASSRAAPPSAATSLSACASRSSRRSLPRLRDRLQQLAEARHAVPRLGREVRARVERPPVGRQEDRRRPAALPGHRHACVHRQRVDVGPLLAVDLDVDEELVHHRCRRLIGERLVLHHVAPVARAVADRDEQRPLLCPRARRMPRRPTGTSRPGCPRAGGGTGSTTPRGGSCLVGRRLRVGRSAALLPLVPHELDEDGERDRDHEGEQEALPGLLLELLAADVAEQRRVAPPDQPPRSRRRGRSAGS